MDTGSSNTWVGAGTAYVKTSTSVATGETVVSIRACYSYTSVEDMGCHCRLLIMALARSVVRTFLTVTC